jgi:hypothetical protein
MAPSATAAAQGIPGTRARATTATTATVRPTTTTASAPIGSQLLRMSRGDASKAASSRTGATNNANARSGSSVISGVPGRKAAAAPASASSAGYGTPMYRDQAASSAPARRSAMTSSKRTMKSPRDMIPGSICIATRKGKPGAMRAPPSRSGLAVGNTSCRLWGCVRPNQGR